MKQSKKRSAEEKLLIIQEAKKRGVIPTIRKYKISTASLYEWKVQYESGGSENLNSGQAYNQRSYRKLQKENASLKELVADKELQLKIISELLKKKK